MGLETGTYINDLNESWPVGDTDPKAQGDDHLRLIKKTLKNTFPSLSSPFRIKVGSPALGDIIYFDGTNWVPFAQGTTGQFLSTNGTTLVWANANNTLADLSDVTITGPATGEALVYNGSVWVNGLPSVAFDELTDVSVAGASDGEYLKFVGSNWTNVSFVEADAVEVEVRNDTGSTLPEGSVVYQTGYSTPGKAITVALADASDPSKMPAIGVVEDGGIAPGDNGHVTVYGTMQNLNTSALTQNQALYVATTPGQYTTTRPTDPAHAVQKIGVVGRVNTANGTVTIVGAGRTNDVPNEINNPMFVTESAYIGSSADENLRLSATSGPTIRLHGGSSGSPAGAMEFEVGGAQYFWPTSLPAGSPAGRVLAYGAGGQMSWSTGGAGGGVTNPMTANLDVGSFKIFENSTNNEIVFDNGVNNDMVVTNNGSGDIVLSAPTGVVRVDGNISSIDVGANIDINLGSPVLGVFNINTVSWPQTLPSTGQILKATSSTSLDWAADNDNLPNIVGGTGITVTEGSPQFTVALTSTNISQFTNDANYLVEGSPGTVIKSGSNISLLTNDSGYLTAIPGSPQIIYANNNISLLTNDAGYVTQFGSPGTHVEKLELSSIVGSPGGTYTISSADFDKKNETNATTIVVPGGVLETGRTVNLWLNSSATITSTGSPNLDFATGAGSPNATIAKGWLTLYNTGTSVKVQ